MQETEGVRRACLGPVPQHRALGSLSVPERPPETLLRTPAGRARPHGSSFRPDRGLPPLVVNARRRNHTEKGVGQSAEGLISHWEKS